MQRSPKVSGGGTANQYEIRGALTAGDSMTIRAGYSANAEIVLEALQGVLAVPEAAVEFAGDSAFVQVLTSQPGARPQTFVRRAIRTGLSDGVNIQVKDGLKKGERVRGNEKLEQTSPQQ